MKVPLSKEDIPVLTQREFAILLALAGGKKTGYEIARQAEKDTSEMVDFSNGTLYPALKRLEEGRLIESSLVTSKTAGKEPKLYALSYVGKMILEWRLQELRKLVRLGEERL
jgi:DNA-binding PadR family transcriptional regulator